MSQALANISLEALRGPLTCGLCSAENIPTEKGFFLTTSSSYVMYPNKCVVRAMPAPPKDGCAFPTWTSKRPAEGVTDCMTFACPTCLRNQVVNKQPLTENLTSQEAYYTFAKRICTGLPSYMSVTSDVYTCAVSISSTVPALTPLNIDTHYVPTDVCGGFMGAGPYGVRVGQYVSYIAPNFTVVPSFGVLLYVGNVDDRLQDKPSSCPYPIAMIQPLGNTDGGVTATIVVPLSSVGSASNPVRGVLPLHYWLPDASSFKEPPLDKADEKYVGQMAALRPPHMDDMMAIDKSVYYYTWYWLDDEHAVILSTSGPTVQDQEAVIANAVTYGALYPPAVGAIIDYYKHEDANDIERPRPYRNDMVSPYGFYGVLHANAAVKSSAPLPLQSVAKHVNANMKAVFPEVSLAFTDREIALAYDNTRPTLFSPPLTTRWTAQHLPEVAFGGPFLDIGDRKQVLPAFQAMIDTVWYQTAARVADSTSYAALWEKDVIPPSLRWQNFIGALHDVRLARSKFSNNLDTLELEGKSAELRNPAEFKASVKASVTTDAIRVNKVMHRTYGVFQVQPDGSVGLATFVKPLAGASAAGGKALPLQMPPMPPFVADMFVRHVSSILTDGDARAAGMCPVVNPLFKRYLHANAVTYTPFIDVIMGAGNLHTAVLAAWNIYVAWKMKAGGVCGYVTSSVDDGSGVTGLQVLAPALCVQYFAKEQIVWTAVPDLKETYGLPQPDTLTPRQRARLQFEITASKAPRALIQAIATTPPGAASSMYPVTNPLDMLYMVLSAYRATSMTTTRAVWDLATKVLTSREDVCGLVTLWGGGGGGGGGAGAGAGGDSSDAGVEGGSDLLNLPGAKHVMSRIMSEAKMQKRMTGAPQTFLENSKKTKASLLKTRRDKFKRLIQKKELEIESGINNNEAAKTARKLIEDETAEREERKGASNMVQEIPSIAALLKDRGQLLRSLETFKKNLADARDEDLLNHEAQVARTVLTMMKDR